MLVLLGLEGVEDLVVGFDEGVVVFGVVLGVGLEGVEEVLVFVDVEEDWLEVFEDG